MSFDYNRHVWSAALLQLNDAFHKIRWTPTMKAAYDVLMMRVFDEGVLQFRNLDPHLRELQHRLCTNPQARLDVLDKFESLEYPDWHYDAFPHARSSGVATQAIVSK